MSVMRGYAEFAEGSSPDVTQKFAHTLHNDSDDSDEYVSKVLKDLLQYVQGMRARLALRVDDNASGEPVNELERNESETGRAGSQR